MTLFTSKWLLCPPRNYNVTYEINPWMNISHVPNRERAAAQWQTLHHTVIRLGAWVEHLEQPVGVPDLVFTANGGLVRGNTVVLPRFKFPERAAETPYFREWFADHGYLVKEVTSGFFEGEGDALSVGDTLVGGYGPRSDEAVYPELANIFSVKVVAVALTDPRFYHLDTCFCPLNESLALYFPPAFTEDGRKALANVCELIEVPESDALRFACNSVVLGQDVVIPDGCDATEKFLRERGFHPYPVCLDEFLKAGGAAKCLCLRLP